MSKKIAYKAFNQDWTCKGFQYEVGKTYKHDGKVEICETGFHACENPLDCWRYYDLTESKFAEVELSGKTDSRSDDSKIASAEITIKAELSLPEFIQRGVDWLMEKTKGGEKNDNGNDYAQIGSSGDSARIGSSGYSARIGSSGYSARIGSSGDYAQIGSSGDYARIGSSGYSARIGSSGYSAQIGSSGDYARIGSSGYSARIGSSGYSAQIGSSGDSAQIGSSGDYARINSEGEKAVIAAAGSLARVKAKTGAWISLAEFNEAGDCVGFATGCIGKDGLKADTWYRAKDGRLVGDD